MASEKHELKQEIKHIIDNYELDFDVVRDIVHKLRTEVDLSFIRHQQKMKDEKYQPIWEALNEDKKKETSLKAGIYGYIAMPWDNHINWKKWDEMREIEKRFLIIQMKGSQ